jgi:hypothetical protein
VRSGESYDTGPKLASWLFGARLSDGEPPRFVLLLCGGVLVLADRRSWEEGRFLAADLDAAFARNDRTQTGELATIAALFSREMLVRTADGKPCPMDDLLAASTTTTGVTSELRDGLKRSVEIIANEVLDRLDESGVAPRELEKQVPIARQLTRETLRYLYRILFLLYAEARPELKILPSDDRTYEAGYSVDRLRELVARDEQLVEEEARTGFHLFTSLDVLFDKVNNGHRSRNGHAEDEQPDGPGLRFEPLRSTLFESESITLIGRVPDPRSDNGATLDLRLRNDALHQVLRLLTMKKGSSGERGGFISYRNLGINQLGAVYEGLISYTGIIAEEELCEVADTRMESAGGSWLIPAHRQGDYPADALVRYDEHDKRRGLRGVKRYQRGEFVYRLAGRDRETAAAYYTPESLTKATVELTLAHRLDQKCDGERTTTRAAELLRWTICEPALGSGAFANEAINQVAEEYLRRRQNELAVSIPAGDLLDEKQKVKAYIALHNVYGVDLNATGVEPAEVSLWLNTMHAGMQAPWFGLHLRRGNSLIGARRAVYSGDDVTSKDKAWLKTKNGLAPTPLPFPERIPGGAVHQFLLPSPGWAAIADSKNAKELAPDGTKALTAWRRGVLTRPSIKQRDRLQAAARRVEFLWSLVIKRMELSERAIARRIPIWGADSADAEFAFMRQPAQAVPKEQVLQDLFNAVDTPYWRLKKVMDTWCALWFWPPGDAALLDGNHHIYNTAVDDAAVLHKLLDPAPQQPAAEEQAALFTVGGEQLTLDTAEPYVVTPTTSKPGGRQPRGKKPPVQRALLHADAGDGHRHR